LIQILTSQYFFLPVGLQSKLPGKDKESTKPCESPQGSLRFPLRSLVRLYSFSMLHYVLQIEVHRCCLEIFC